MVAEFILKSSTGCDCRVAKFLLRHKVYLMFQQSFSDTLRPHGLVERVVMIRQIPELVDRRLTGSNDESRIRIDALSFDNPANCFNKSFGISYCMIPCQPRVRP